MTKPAMAPAGKPVSHGLVALAVFALVLLLQLPLALSPGYFSRDELQWSAIAAQGGAFDWHAVQTFQYRPLTSRYGSGCRVRCSISRRRSTR